MFPMKNPMNKTFRTETTIDNWYRPHTEKNFSFSEPKEQQKHVKISKIKEKKKQMFQYLLVLTTFNVRCDDFRSSV